MARKLKTYQASIGFFDLAVAAPSMRAALEAWGANSNLFHQGVAKQVDDPDVVAATMSEPGVVLRRPVGSNGPFKEHASLPTHLSRDAPNRKPTKHTAKPKRASSLTKIDDSAARKAALAFEKEQSRRESERRKEEDSKQKERQRRERTIAKVQSAFAKANREHENRANAIETERASIEKRAQAEEARWKKQKEKLKLALQRAQR